MKKFLIITSLILILLVIAFFVFVLTFDANKYKELLISKIEDAIKKDVMIANISLNPWHGLGVRVDGVSIKAPDKKWEDALLKVSSIDATINILPLIKKDIQIQNLSIDGLMMNISKDSFIIPVPVAPDPGQNAGGAAGALKFLAKNIYILDSSIHYKDGLAGKPLDIQLDIISARLRNISIYGPVNIEASLSIFGRGKENIKVKAILYPEMDTKSPFLKNLELKVNLDKLDINGLIKALGLRRSQQIVSKEFSGQLVISSEKIYLDPKKIYGSRLYVDLSNAKTDVLPIKSHLENINLKAEFNNGDLDIERLNGSIAGGDFSARGAIKDVVMHQDLNLDIGLKDIDVSGFLPEPPRGSPSFKAILNLGTQVSANGLSKDNILDTLKAKGKMNLDNAMLDNLNVLRVALDKLNMLPGLVQRLKDNLPLKYSELLKQNFTTFKPMNADFEIRTGRLFFEKLIIESDAFYLVAKGSIGLNGDLQVNSTLFIPQDLSDAFISSVPELIYLKDNNGMITMPLDIAGKLPNISVMPNLDYVIQRLAVSKGQELLDRIFKKQTSEQKGQEEGGSQEEGREGSSTEKPIETILRGVLDIITKPSQPEDK